MKNEIKLHDLKYKLASRAPWPCGLIRHVLNREVRGSNLGGGSQNLSYFRIEERALVREVRRNGRAQKDDAKDIESFRDRGSK